MKIENEPIVTPLAIDLMNTSFTLQMGRDPNDAGLCSVPVGELRRACALLSEAGRVIESQEKRLDRWEPESEKWKVRVENLERQLMALKATKETT